MPIIVVTARGEEADRVVGLELGADDYVVKPYGLRELIARIRAVTRRAASRAGTGGPLRAGELEVDERARRATLGGRELELTPKEFELLAALARDPGAAVSRQRLLAEVWQTSWYGSSKTIDVHVAALRRKLGDPGLDRDRARHRLPSARAVTRRLLLGYLGVTLFVLLSLEVPLGVQNQRTERHDLTAKVSHDATVLAADAEDAVQAPTRAARRLAAVAADYAGRTGARVVIVDRAGYALRRHERARARHRELRVAARDRSGARRQVPARRPQLEDPARATALRRRADRRRRQGARGGADHVSLLRRRRAHPSLLAHPRA